MGIIRPTFLGRTSSSEKRAMMEQEGMVFKEKGKIKPYS